MTTLERLGADDLRHVVDTFRDALQAHKEGINRLNVYPVPDGDTGSNMALTLASVASELDGVDAVGLGVLTGNLIGIYLMRTAPWARPNLNVLLTP